MSSITISTEITAPDVSADVDIVLSPGEFVQAMVAHEREAARLALALRRLENSGELATVDKALTTRAWLRDRCRMTDEQAGRWVARARFLDRFSTIAERAAAGELSAGQVEVRGQQPAGAATNCSVMVHHVRSATCHAPSAYTTWPSVSAISTAPL